MGSIGMKYKESVQSSGSNNNTYNLRVPGSGTKMSSHVTVQAASVSGISGDINVNLMKMFDNSQKKKKENSVVGRDLDYQDNLMQENYDTAQEAAKKIMEDQEFAHPAFWGNFSIAYRNLESPVTKTL